MEVWKRINAFVKANSKEGRAERAEANRDRAKNPKYGDQTACKYCEADIEYIGKGRWHDRGGNTSCNDGKHKHKAVSDHNPDWELPDTR